MFGIGKRAGLPEGLEQSGFGLRLKDQAAGFVKGKVADFAWEDVFLS